MGTGNSIFMSILLGYCRTIVDVIITYRYCVIKHVCEKNPNRCWVVMFEIRHSFDTYH